MKKDFSYHIFIKTGPAYETKKNNGISHFLEHIVSGCDLYEDEILSYLDEKDVYEDIGTSNFYTFFSYYFMNEKDLCTLKDKFHTLLKKLEINEEVFEREKEMVKEEIAYVSLLPNYLIKKKSRDLLFSKTKLNKPILGDISNIYDFKLEDARGWFKDHYKKGNFVEVIYNKDKDKISFLSKLDAGNIKSIPSINTINKVQENTLSDKNESTPIRLAWSVDMPTIKERVLLDIISNMIKGTGNSLLSKDIQKQGLLYKASVSTHHFKESSLLFVDLFTTKGELVVKKIKNFIKSLSLGKIRDNNFKYARESEENFYSNPSIDKVDVILEDYLSTGDLVMSNDYLNLVKEISKGDIVEFTKRFHKNLSIIVSKERE